MANFVVLFEDEPSLAELVREHHMAEHLAFLGRHAAVRAAGPLQDAADGTPAGGLWLVEAADPAEVAALVRADPFWPTGLRRSARILAWRQVHGVRTMPPGRKQAECR